MNDEYENGLVRFVAKVIRTFGSVFVALFDEVKRAIDHANPSLFAVDATLLPYILPIPVAIMTARSAQTFYGWGTPEAYILGIGLEGLGLYVWVKLADSVLAYIRSNNKKVSMIIWILAGVAVAYEALLIILNVVLAWKEKPDWMYISGFLIICLLPALSATLYGYQKKEVEFQLGTEKSAREAKAEQVRQEALAQKEKERQERREDRFKMVQIKLAQEAELAKLGTNGHNKEKDKSFRG